MKKWIVIIIIVLVFALFRCDGSGSDDATVDSSDLYGTIAEDSIVLDKMQYFHNYVAEKGIEIPEFKEYEDIANTLTDSNFEDEWGNYVDIEKDPTFSEKVSYTVTLEGSEYVYWGELNKDSKPDGIGIVYEYSSNYMDSELFIKYIGEFEDGYPSGYGIEFDIPDLYNDYPVQVTDEMFDENLPNFNQPIYEGYFEDGRRSGEGIEIISNYGGVHVETGEVLLDPNKTGYCVYIGEYKKGKLNGECLIYDYGVLVYEGGFKNGDMNGEGIEYFYDNPGTVKYEGEFSGGVYSGKGVLYDENGDVIHKGEFVSGDIK